MGSKLYNPSLDLFSASLSLPAAFLRNQKSNNVTVVPRSILFNESKGKPGHVLFHITEPVQSIPCGASVESIFSGERIECLVGIPVKCSLYDFMGPDEMDPTAKVSIRQIDVVGISSIWTCA